MLCAFDRVKTIGAWGLLTDLRRSKALSPIRNAHVPLGYSTKGDVSVLLNSWGI